MADFKGVNKKGNYFDDWELHKNDYHVWRKFWALYELRRKWEWADWFYKQLDRTDGEIVAPIYWGIAGGTQYMKLCLWIALLKSVHEGLTEGLNSYDTPKSERVDISKVFPNVPKDIRDFPETKKFKRFRNAVFHCQWHPMIEKFKLSQEIVNKIEELHKKLGKWLKDEFEKCRDEFKNHYSTPKYWIFDMDFWP